MSNPDINIKAVNFPTVYTLADAKNTPIVYFKYHNGLIHICESDDFQVTGSYGEYSGYDSLSITYENLKAILEALENNEIIKESENG